MPKQIPISSIVSAVLDGFAEAQKNYENWSGGFWLWEAPEYLISSTVAKHIADLNGAKYVTLEHGATRALKEAGAKGKGRLPRNFREKGRVDILLWWGEDIPRAVIEIKNQIYSKEQYKKDIERICGFLQRNNENSSLQFGIFAFYESDKNGSHKTATEKIENRIENIFNNCKKIAGDGFNVTKSSSQIEVIEESAWAATCLIFRKNEG